MPYYPYECRNRRCKGYAQERVVVKSIVNADRVELCPYCEEPMTRRISNTNFVLKGSGWYGK